MSFESYKQYIPALHLSIERNTQNVPTDNCYYIIRNNTVLGKYRSLKKAEELFRAIVEESGYKPSTKEIKPKDKADLTVAEFLDRGDEWWASRAH